MLVAALLLIAAPASVATAQSHPAEFWQSIVEHEYALPEGANADALFDELTTFVSNPDPRWRDDFGYSIGAHWMYSKAAVSPAAMQRAKRVWIGNLSQGVGETGNDGVITRSFAALNLSIVAAVDVARPFLSVEEYRALLDAALSYFANERDLRSYQLPQGWIHSAAHTADLLKFLARNKNFTVADQTRVLDAIAAKQSATRGQVFTFGEDERFASTVLSIVRRSDFAPAAFESFVNKLIAVAGIEVGTTLDLNAFAAAQNCKALLKSLYAALTLPESPQANEVAAAAILTKALRAS